MSEGQLAGAGRDRDGAGYAPNAPAGYRRTEVGVIPEDWEVDRIDQHTSIKTGSKNTQDKEEGGEYPFFVRSQEVERIGTYSYDGEAVLTAGDGVRTGKVFHYMRGRFDVHQRVYRISDFSDRLNGRYFFFQFSERFYHRIMSMTAKSSVDSVRMEMIAGMRIPLPPPREQRAIAAVLSDVDELIGSLEELIAKKRAIRQAVMQQLLTGRTRLPGFGREWETQCLGDVATILMGRTPSRSNASFWGGSHPWLSVGDLREKVVTESKERITELATAQMRVVPAGTLLMSFKLSIGRLAFAGCDLYTNEAICHLTHVAAHAHYLYYGLQRVDFSTYGRQAVKGHTLNSESLGTIELPLPPLPEQRAIATVLSDMDAEITALERRLDKTRAIKQGMMQQLLTGSIRLPIPGDEMEDDHAHDA